MPHYVMNHTQPSLSIARLRTLVASVASVALSAGLQAEFIQPVAVLTSNGQASQEALINGEGWENDAGLGSPDAIHNRFGSDMWSSIGSIKEYAVFDLGKTVSLTRLHLWNYNVQDATDVGMKDVEVLVSSDTNMTNANFNAIARISLKEGGQEDQKFDVVGTNVRLVKLKGLSNWGQGYTVGLAEARFESGDIVGNVPQIVLNSPRDGDEIALGAVINVDARITDKDGTAADIQKIELFDNGVLVTNKTTSIFAAAITGAAKGDHTIRIVATDKSGKSSWVTANLFVRELVADRIVKVDDNDLGNGLNQVQYVGAWQQAPPSGNNDPRYNHSDHYNASNNKNDYFLLRFKGVKVDVFSTVASHHGTGMASIDGGPESKVNYKATQRAEQVFLWGSPILPNREHTLKIRLVGDGVVTADRFDISVSDKPEVTNAVIKEVVATFTNVVVKLEDAPSAPVDPSSIRFAIDGVTKNVSVTRVAPLTTVTYLAVPPFNPGSTHTVQVASKDTKGSVVTNEANFSLPAPPFPLGGLGGPSGAAGGWGLRQIWNAGRADALASAVGIAVQAGQAGFAGMLRDDVVPFINLTKNPDQGDRGYFAGDIGLPALEAGLPASDFVVVARAQVRIPRAGDWTIGVHSDEGFGLRFIGAAFDSVSGGGQRDDNFPEYMFAPNNTTDSNTRGVLKNVPAGTYGIEFISWERVGSAFYEVYAAEGAFADDADTDQWALIGGEGGLELVAPKPSLNAVGIVRVGDEVSVDFTSTVGGLPFQLQESGDLKNWSAVGGATFTDAGGGKIRARATAVKAGVRFYRIAVP